MPPRTRIFARRESSGEFASQPHDSLQRGCGRGRSRGRRGVNAWVLEGVEYDWFDTVTRGRLVGSPSLAWGEFSRLFMARFLLESVRDGLAHGFERLEQIEGMSVSEYSARFTQLSRHAPYLITKEMCVKRFVRGLREYIFRSVVGSNCSTFAEVQQRAVSQRGGSSGQSFGIAQSRRSNQGRSSRITFPQRHFGVTFTPCPTYGRLHTEAPFAPVRQLGGSSGRGSGVAQQSGRGSGSRGQAHAGRGQARVFAITSPFCSNSQTHF
ncbi:Retrotransposon gag domain [Sesbania bispinosa]|nr:Retrotransposon gag domain [Sesbania bispinosa]